MGPRPGLVAATLLLGGLPRPGPDPQLSTVPGESEEGPAGGTRGSQRGSHARISEHPSALPPPSAAPVSWPAPRVVLTAPGVPWAPSCGPGAPVATSEALSELQMNLTAVAQDGHESRPSEGGQGGGTWPSRRGTASLLPGGGGTERGRVASLGRALPSATRPAPRPPGCGPGRGGPAVADALGPPPPVPLCSPPGLRGQPVNLARPALWEPRAREAAAERLRGQVRVRATAGHRQGP